MKDHESVVVKQLHDKRDKMLEEKRLLEDEVFRTASIPDKIHVYLTMLAIVVIVFSPIYIVVSLVRLYAQITTKIVFFVTDPPPICYSMSTRN